MKLLFIIIALLSCSFSYAAPSYKIVKVEESVDDAENIIGVKFTITATEGNFSLDYHHTLSSDEVTNYRADKSTLKKLSEKLAADIEESFKTRLPKAQVESLKVDATSSASDFKDVDPDKVAEEKAK